MVGGGGVGRRSHVVAVPYPGRGHINPLLNLCNSLARRRTDLIVTVVVTEEWRDLLGSDRRLELEPIRVRSIPNVLPSEHGRFGDMNRFIDAVLTKMEAPVERVLDELDPPPCVIIADTFLPWAVDSGRRRNVPVASFWPMNATVFSVFCNLDLICQHGHYPTRLLDRAEELVDYIPGVTPTRLADLPSIIHASDGYLLQRVRDVLSRVDEVQCVLFSSVYELEYHTIDAMRLKLAIPMYCVGPLLPPGPVGGGNASYMKWLDSRPVGSVLYVSMGSLVSVSEAQMDEIATGLAESGCWYFWVARGGALGLRDVSGDKGFVVDWCDQMAVLHHAAVGGFWTHCGWNSVQEGVFAGVPMLGFPVVMDQGPNSKLMESDWGIGLRLKTDRGKAEDLVGREEIAERVKRFMDAESGERRKMMNNAKQLQILFKQAIAEGGSSAMNLESFIKQHANNTSIK